MMQINKPLLFLIFLFIVVVASVVTGAASMVFYALGQKGSEAVFEKHPHLDRKRWDQVQSWYMHYGTAVLSLTVVPGLSAVIIMAAGVVGIRERSVLIWAIIGRFVRYMVYMVLVLLLYFGIQLLL